MEAWLWTSQCPARAGGAAPSVLNPIAKCHNFWYNSRRGGTYGPPISIRYVPCDHAVRRRINDIQALLRVSAKHPIQVLCLLGLLVLVTVGRPWSCITHCVSIDANHQRHGHTIHSGWSPDDGYRSYSTASLVDGYDPCDDQAPQSPQPTHEEPSPLTVAVILPLLLLAHLRRSPLDRIQRTFSLFSYSPSPPIRPPTSFICSSH